ncbi:hypothetical protein ACFLYD_06380 [Chloroflexota bacterium]
MAGKVICTIIAKNYLAQARCLVDSFLEHHPDGRAFVLVIDDLDCCYDPDREHFTTVPVEEIGIPDLQAMIFRYTVLELSTAVKPFFLEYLFEHHGCRKLCYFDPDIHFYAPIDEIWELLDSQGIVLTPHLLGFLDDQHRPNERDILIAGAYNLGFLGLSRHPELIQFLRWWQAKLVRDCVVAFDKGLFVDQRWMDLVPSLFSNVYIHRDPACNVAYWNLNHRQLVREEQGGYTVNGQPLKFFHFSGFSPDQMSVVSKHQTRLTFGNSPYLKPLFSTYRDCLLNHSYDTAKQWPYTHNYHEGVRIPDVARTLFRELEENEPAWDPFQTAPDDQYVSKVLSWLNQAVDDGQPPVTQLALGIYERRPDLQQACPDVLGDDRQLYIRWFVTRGKDEYGLDGFFLKPVTERKAPAGLQLKDLSARQLGVRFYYSVTDWFYRIGVGASLERRLGERRVSAVRSFFVRPDPRRRAASRPLPPFTAPQEAVAQPGDLIDVDAEDKQGEP